VRRLALLPVLVLGLAACAAPVPSPDLPPVDREPVHVFAAASLAEAFDILAVEFEAWNPVDIVLNVGGSSTLAAQIVAGAPADVFAAANLEAMATVVDAGLATDPVVFATNTLELVVPAGNPGGVTGVGDLADPDLVVVLCAAEVPCGAASQRVLDLAGVQPSADSYEQDVTAVLTKVALGEADAGLVYVTDVRTAGDAVEGIAVPEAAQVVNEYPIAAIGDSPAAAEFVAWVLSSSSMFEGRGFGAP